MKPIKTRQRGVAIIEFALILPLLILLAIITTEFGRAMYQYNTLAKTVRQAARYLSIQTPGTHLAEARNLVVYGNTTGTGYPVVPGLTAAHVPDPAWESAGEEPIINTVTIQVTNFEFNAMYSSVFGYVFPPLTFPDIRATMRSHL